MFSRIAANFDKQRNLKTPRLRVSLLSTENYFRNGSETLALSARVATGKVSTIFTPNKTFSQWNKVFADVTIASAILDRVLHHCAVINIKGESSRLKERKEYMKQKQAIVNTLFKQNAQ